MQSQTNIKSTDEDIEIQSIIKAAIKKKFYTIYNAAKERDHEVLKKIKEEYLTNEFNTTFAFSILVDGHTPLSLLASEGDYGSALFLITDVAGNIQEAIIGCVHRNDRPHIFNLSSLVFSDPFYYLLMAEKISIYLANQQKDLADFILNKLLTKKTIAIFAEAMLGNFQKVNSLIEETTGNFWNIYMDELVYPSIAYCYGFKGHKKSINLIWKTATARERASLIKGSLDGGYIRQAEKLFEKWQGDRGHVYAIRFGPPSNLLYPDIQLMVLSYINLNSLRSVFYSARSSYLDKNPDKLNSYNKLLKDALIVHHYYQNYHLDFYKSLVCARKETVGWLFTGMQLVKAGKLLPDLLINILSFTVSPKLSHVELTDLFQKVYLAINKSFFMADLDSHLLKLYDKNRYYKKIENLKKTCLHVEFLQDLQSLVHQQYSLFCQKESTNNCSEMNREQHASEQNQDQEKFLRQQQKQEFRSILKKHTHRL